MRHRRRRYYAAAQSHQKLGATNEARKTYGQLAARPEVDVWHFVGLAGQQLLDSQTEAALQSARQASEMAGDIPDVHYLRRLDALSRQPAGSDGDSP